MVEYIVLKLQMSRALPYNNEANLQMIMLTIFLESTALGNKKGREIAERQRWMSTYFSMLRQDFLFTLGPGLLTVCHANLFPKIH